MYKRLIKLFGTAYILEWVFAMVCIVFVTLSQLALAPLSGYIAKAFGDKNLSQLTLFVFAVIGLFFIKGVFMYFQSLLLGDVALKIVKTLREMVFEHLHRLPVSFFRDNRTGDIISRLSNDLTLLKDALIIILAEFIPHSFLFFVILGYLFYLNWHLAAITLLVIPVSSYVIGIFGERIRLLTQDAQSKVANVLNILEENLNSITIIKILKGGDYEKTRFNAENTKNYHYSFRSIQALSLQAPVVGVLQVIGIAIALWVGGYEVFVGNMKPESIISFAVAIALIIDPVVAFSKAYTQMKIATVGLERIFHILDQTPIGDDGSDTLPKELKPTVSINNVSLQINNTPILENINVDIPAGSVTAIVGPSGAGKSTIINILFRLLEPTKGQVNIAGKDISNISRGSLYDYITLIPQESYVFAGTIRENLMYAKPGATWEEVERACKLAHIDDFIQSLPEKYDYKIVEKGFNLSGGQKQRLSIARAILRDSKILVMDEATSALDVQSEAIIQQTIDELRKEKTIILITHRLHTISNVDKVVYIAGGKIVEQGSPVELEQKKGAYYRFATGGQVDSTTFI